MSLDIILPTLNESKGGFFEKTTSTLREFVKSGHPVRVLVVDGGSQDDTLERVADCGFEIVRSQRNSRAERLNEGLRRAVADAVLYHHPRAFLTAEGLEWVCKHGADQPWGCFTHSFQDSDQRLLRFTSWYSNRIRADRKGIVYLDHCPFFSLKHFRKEDLFIPDMDIFEDTELSYRLMKQGLPFRTHHLSHCSAVRFERNGVAHQLALNQVMKICYHAGFSDELMNKVYERGLNFNSTYAKKAAQKNSRRGDSA